MLKKKHYEINGFEYMLKYVSKKTLYKAHGIKETM